MISKMNKIPPAIFDQSDMLEEMGVNS